MGFLSAESDIQISMPIFSFFDNGYAEWQDATKAYSDKTSKMISTGRLEVICIKNCNFPKSQRVGFYETVSLCDPNSANSEDDGIGLLLAVGGLIKLIEVSNTLFNIGAGFHVQMWSPNGIRLGAEGDMHLKFTKNRRCSPVIGATVQCDFYSNEKVGIYYYDNNGYYSSRHSEYYAVDKYFHFFVKPYIALGVNF